MSVIMWVLIIAVVVFLAIAFKAKEIRHKLGLFVAVMIFLFLVFSFFQVYSSHKVDLTTYEGVTKAGKLYALWLGQVFDNVKGTTMYIIKQDWGLNSTKASKIK